MKKAIFPGTFDPFTLGHHSIVKRSLAFMDEVIIGIGARLIASGGLPRIRSYRFRIPWS